MRRPKENSLTGLNVLSAESCIWGLGTLCRLHRVPFAPELLRRCYPPPYTQTIFQRAAEALGFKCGWRAAPARELALLTVPWIALLETPGAGDEASTPNHSLAFILKCTETQITYLREPGSREGEQAPVTEPRSQFESKYGGQALQRQNGVRLG